MRIPISLVRCETEYADESDDADAGEKQRDEREEADRERAVLRALHLLLKRAHQLDLGRLSDRRPSLSMRRWASRVSGGPDAHQHAHRRPIGRLGEEIALHGIDVLQPCDARICRDADDRVFDVSRGERLPQRLLSRPGGDQQKTG